MPAIARQGLATLAILGLLAFSSVASAQEAGLDTTFEKKEKIAGFWLLFVGGDQSYNMSQKVHDKHRRLWPFISRNTRIHLVLNGRDVVRLERGWKARGKVDTQALVRKIRVCKEGDRVSVDGQECLFLRADKTHVTVSPKRSDETGFKGERKIAISRIKTFRRLQAASDATGADLGPDVIDVFKVEVGDTVDVFVGKQAKPLRGSFLKLGKNSAELMEWNASGWGEVRRLLRRQVTKVRHVKLKRVRRIPCKGGALTISTVRYRRGIEGPLETRVRVSHDVPERVMVGLKLVLNLGDRPGGAQAAVAEDSATVPALFTDESHAFARAAIHQRYCDVLVKPVGYKLLAFNDPLAKPYVLKAMDAGPELDYLARLYTGAGATKDLDVIGFLIGRALYPPVREGEQPAAHARAARKGLEVAMPEALERLLVLVKTKAKDIKTVSLVRGKLVEEELVEAIDPDEHRDKLIELVGRLPDTIDHRVAQLLFDLAFAEGQLSKAVERAFAFQPEAVAGLLLAEAIPRKGKAPKKRAELANHILHDLADKLIDLLPALIEQRGIDATDLVASIEKHGAKEPGKAVDVAMRLARKSIVADRVKALETMIKEAKELRDKLEWDQALARVQTVLSKKPEHKAALALLGPVLVGQANALAVRGDASEAIRLLEEAVRVKQAAANKPLAELLLSILEEDSLAVVLREAPILGSPKVGVVAAQARFVGKSADTPGWAEIQTPQGIRFVRAGSLKVTQGVYLAGASPRTSEPVLVTLTARIGGLEPSLKGKADALLGAYYGKMATEKYTAGEYSEARAILANKVAILAPDDPSMSLSFKALILGNLWVILGLVVAVVGGGGTIYWLVSQEQERRRSEEQRDTSLSIDLFGHEGSPEIDLFGAEEPTGPSDPGPGPPPAGPVDYDPV
jgi:tetratricopeptide (TPR) repeat protein